MAEAAPFNYPAEPHVRRHGPAGYEDYHSYLDWLRDEFCFRCPMCLQREQWVRKRGEYHIDHFMPQACHPALELEYDNLLYACVHCNSVKGELAIPDPCKVGFGECIEILPDGAVNALSRDGEVLIDVLRLDDDDSTEFRRHWLGIIDLARQHDRELFMELMGFPSDLPDLSKKQPPKNSRAEGVADSYFERRRRGELPGTY